MHLEKRSSDLAKQICATYTTLAGEIHPLPMGQVLPAVLGLQLAKEDARIEYIQCDC